LRGLTGRKLRGLAAEIRLECLYCNADLAAHILVDGIGQMRAGARLEAVRHCLPTLESHGIAGPHRAPTRENRLRHLERRMMPPYAVCGAPDLFLSERRAMGRGGALLFRRAIADDGPAGDQRRLIGDGPGIGDGEGNSLGVVTVDLCRVPA